MGNPKGSRYENELLKYLRNQNLDAERLRLTGKDDEGDILIRDVFGATGRLVLEAKNRAQMNLAGWIREAEVESQNYATHRGLPIDDIGFAVVHKQRGKGAAFSYVTLPLYEYLEQIR